MKRLTTFIAGAAVAATLGGCQQPAVSGWKSFSGDKNIERRVDSVLSLMKRWGRWPNTPVTGM